MFISDNKSNFYSILDAFFLRPKRGQIRNFTKTLPQANFFLRPNVSNWQFHETIAVGQKGFSNFTKGTSLKVSKSHGNILKFKNRFWGGQKKDYPI